MVTYPQLKAMLSHCDVQLFDVREPQEFQEGHIPDAVNIPRRRPPNCCRAFREPLTSFGSVSVNSSGRGGRVLEAVPRAVSAEVQREGSWERRREHCVLLQERQQELQSSFHGTAAGFHQVNQPGFVIIRLFSPIIQHLNGKIQISLFTWVLNELMDSPSPVCLFLFKI